MQQHSICSCGIKTCTILAWGSRPDRISADDEASSHDVCNFNVSGGFDISLLLAIDQVT